MSTVLVPAAMAGVVAVAATVAVERLGGRRGGILASIPTTIVPASIGMLAGATDTAAFGAAMAAVPAGMLVDAAFLWTWRAVPRHLPARSLHLRLAMMAALSLSVWALGALGFVVGMNRLAALGVSPLVPGLGCLVVLVVVGVASCWRPPPAPKGSRSVAPGMLALRGLLAATAIGASVLVANAGAPVAGGMASVFPAIFLTTMVSLWLAQGEAVPIGAVGPIILGSASVSVYALLAATLLPALGPWLGVPLTWAIAVTTTTLPAAWWLARRPGVDGPES